MRAILQRVTSAKVEVDGRVIGDINAGWLVLLGIGVDDDDGDIEFVSSKILNLRGFSKEGSSRFDESVLDSKKDILVVSQFTLYADCRRGRRPSFSESAPPLEAKLMYEKCVNKLKDSGLRVETGRFQAMMQVSLVNDGPVTFVLDSRK